MTEGINQAMHHIHSYVPQHSAQGKTVYNKVGVVGDQLSVESAVNCLASLANGFTPNERLDGLHLEIADWHAELKFLPVSYLFIFFPVTVKLMVNITFPLGTWNVYYFPVLGCLSSGHNYNDELHSFLGLPM